VERPEAAQKVNSRLSHAQGDLRRVDERRRRRPPGTLRLAGEEADAGRSPTPTPSA
jgi:hypothetical protein